MSHAKFWPLLALTGLLLVTVAPSFCQAEDAKPAPRTRFHQYTEKFKKPTQPVNILRAGYLGGPGTEWLVGGGFLPDGGLILGGAALGPVLELNGVKASVIGEDTPAPTYERKTTKGKQGPVKEPVTWAHPNATAFVVKLSADGTVEKAVRFPWKAAGLTSAVVDQEGAVYIGGLASEAFDKIGAATDVTVAKDEGDTTPWPKKAYVAKLAPDLSSIVWLRLFGEVQAPVLNFKKNGDLHAECGWGYVFSKDGELKEHAKLWIVSKWARGVNPENDEHAVGTDNNTHTGREPWRKPLFLILDKDRNIRYHLYEWHEKLVGAENLRLVSDSSIRHLAYDAEGMLYAIGWSDGGNTVLERIPYDIRRKQPHEGIGFSAWGVAGAMSITHIIRLDPKTAEVVAKTTWVGYLSGKNAPSSTKISHINTGADGSVLLAGGAAFGLIQTGDALHPDPERPGGPCIAILDRNLSTIRFSSTMLACGAVEIRPKEDWGTVSQTIQGKPLALFTTGAEKEGAAYTDPHPAPSKNPVQAQFGGGEMDGYFVLVDLTAPPAPESPATEPKVDEPAQDESAKKEGK